MRRFVLLLFGLVIATSQLLAPADACAQARGTSAQRLYGTMRDTLGRALPGVEVRFRPRTVTSSSSAKVNDQASYAVTRPRQLSAKGG